MKTRRTRAQQVARAFCDDECVRQATYRAWWMVDNTTIYVISRSITAAVAPHVYSHHADAISAAIDRSALSPSTVRDP